MVKGPPYISVYSYGPGISIFYSSSTDVIHVFWWEKSFKIWGKGGGGIQAHSIPGFQQSWHINLLQLINRRHACFNFDGKIWLQLACSLVQSVSNKELRWVFFFNENNKIWVGWDQFGLVGQFIFHYFFIWNYYSSPSQLRYPQLSYFRSYAILNWVLKNSS